MNRNLSYHSDDERIAFCAANGVEPSQHCCLDMAWFIAKPVEWESQGPNPVILWISSWNEYRIEISRQGNSSTLIRFCPWCGVPLAESKKALWYDTLYQRGYDDPGGEDNIPKEFETDQWWRNPKT